MSDPDAYVMLISSLPSSEKLFLAKQPPLSRLKLEQRLRVLDEDDAITLRLVEQTLNWRELPMDATEADIIAKARRTLARLDSQTLREIVRQRFDIRTVVAALRRQAHGDGPPAADDLWGMSRWTSHIVRNWTEPGFRMGGVFPWVQQAGSLLEKRDPVGLERLILDQSYKLLQRHAGQHIFDFEAVVIYVLKWNIFDRWAGSNAEAASRRFEELTLAGLGAHAELSFDGEA